MKTVEWKGLDRVVKHMKGAEIYNLVIENKTRHPAGILKWKEVTDINDEEIKFAFMFVNKCSLSTFDRAFQYKINTQILPTKEYLFRYRVAETNVCTRCNSEPDTVLHSLWSNQRKIKI